MPELEQWPTPRLLSTAARLVEHAWNEKLAALRITHAGMIALDVLDAEGPLTQAALAAKIRVQAQTMGKTLSRLEQYGHIQRERNVRDRRSHVVTLTDAGRDLLEDAHKLERGLFDSSDVSADQFRNNLKNVIRALSSAQLLTAGSPLGLVPHAPELRESGSA